MEIPSEIIHSFVYIFFISSWIHSISQQYNDNIIGKEYVINRARKDKSSLLRNAKLRLSNIHPGRLLMNLRGQDKWLK